MALRVPSQNLLRECRIAHAEKRGPVVKNNLTRSDCDAARRHSSSGTAALIDQRHLMTGVDKAPRTSEPGHTGSNNHDPHDPIASTSQLTRQC
jgi:hypothetical protein